MIERLLLSLFLVGIGFLIFWWIGRWQHNRAREATQNIKASGKARLLYFHSRACAACTTQVRIFAQLDGRMQSLIEPIDAEEEETVTKQYNILTLPTTILIDRHGNVQHINYGLTNLAKLSQQLQALA
jgi:peroxiredoxin